MAVSQLRTVAEQSDYTATATGVEVDAYLKTLVAGWPAAELTQIGETLEGRAISTVVIEPQIKTPQRPLTVLILGGIHSGECDGKEGLLALARDMAIGKRDTWWQSLRLILVPNFSADANERRGIEHRPGQAGPEAGMGVRENPQGLDLNRDFVKIETPEVRSLVAALDRFDVDVLIDLHTTNGSLHRYDLTYDIPHNPMLSPAINDWLRGTMMPKVTAAMSEAGFSTFYYGNFDREHRKWTTFGHQPRYSTEYMGLRGRIGILSESYSYVSYQRRIEASYWFTIEVLRTLVDQQTEIGKLLDASTAAGTPGQEIPLRADLAKTADGQLALGFRTAEGALPSRPFNNAALSSHEPKDYLVELWNRFEATESVSLPTAYAIPGQYAWAVDRLRRHGIQVERLDEPVTASTETYQVTALDRGNEFQAHRMLSVQVDCTAATQELPAGTFVVPVEQTLGRMAAYLLEPRADDSLLAWNFFDPDIFVGADYPVLRIMQDTQDFLMSSVEQVPAAEMITLEHLSRPNFIVDYDSDLRRTAKWLGNTSEYVVRSSSEHFVVDAATGTHRQLSELGTLATQLGKLDEFSADEANAAAKSSTLSDDLAFGLIHHNQDLYFYDAATPSARRLTHSGDAEEELAELNPQGTHAAFVRGNDLWVVECSSGKETQLTDTGSAELLNGKLDWVYQEELYGRGNFKAFWWSPDGESIAFLRLDETPVPHYQVSDSISFGQTLEDTRYPKAGEPLPHVSAWISEVATGQLHEIDLSAYPADDRLIARVTWAPKGDVWLQVLNRVQNRLWMVAADAAEGSTRQIFQETSPGWIEVRGTPQHLEDGRFLWLSDLPAGRTHLFRIHPDTGAREQLTQGDWEVSKLVGVSRDHTTAFVTGNISHPTESQLVAIDLSTGQVKQITQAAGTHSVQLDASGEYFIDVFSSVTEPARSSLYRRDGSLVRVVDFPISDRYRFLKLREPLQTTIPAADGVPLQASIMLPEGYDAQQPTEKLPVLFFVYGGPQAPTVKNAWAGRNYWWHQMLCQRGFAIVLCDNRSARGRGVADTWTIRGDMGRVEMQDLESVASWVSQQAWADPDRLGIWGWSYGGYFTAYAMTHSDIFKVGISGAPVTDWNNYDAIYTERYMDLPETNPEGYASSSVVKSARDLSGQMMIIHGERDDNVHMSNTLQLVYELQKAGKLFDLMIYPKNRHGIVDPDQKYHLQKMMTEYLEKHLK